MKKLSLLVSGLLLVGGMAFADGGKDCCSKKGAAKKECTKEEVKSCSKDSAKKGEKDCCSKKGTKVATLNANDKREIKEVRAMEKERVVSPGQVQVAQ